MSGGTAVIGAYGNDDKGNSFGSTYIFSVSNTDQDNDGFDDNAENCPFMANPDQKYTDMNSVDDTCDEDDNGDEIADNIDNCPLVANSDQLDTDGDSIGNACDNKVNMVPIYLLLLKQ